MGPRKVYVLGSINLDIFTQVSDLPRPGETVTGFSVTEIAGGKGANQAVAAARIGAEVRLIGAVGRDDPGKGLKTFLADAGVNMENLIEMEGYSSGRAFICVDARGENSIVVVGGANLALRPHNVPTVGDLANAVRLAQLETPLETIAAFFQPAAGTNLRILNAAPAHLQAKSLFDLADILILNETELQSFAGLKAPPKDRMQVVDAAKTLMTRPDQSLIVTLGEAGSLLVTEAVAQMVEGRKVSAVDTTGAGDCFCGVLAAFLAGGVILEDAVAQANAAAALSVCKAGAAVSMPHRAELDAFMAAGGPS